MKKITLKDIANRAGVSVALVSNYLNRHPSARMTDQTREKIDQALKDLDYHCSDIARSLRTGRTRIIGYFSENLRNEVTQNEMLEIYDAAAEENYRVIVGFSANRGTTLENIRAFQARGCDAMIVSGYFDQTLAEQIAALPVPTVILSTCAAASIPGKLLRYDYRSAVRDAINYLRERGHSGIYYQTHQLESGDQRYMEFSESVSAERIWLLQNRHITPDEFRVFLDQHPDCTAILHLNDILAMRTLQNCAANGINVPRELSVIGFDNIRTTEYTTPTLSTISRPLSEAAHFAVRTVLDELEKKNSSLPEILPCHFIPRGSAAGMI